MTSREEFEAWFFFDIDPADQVRAGYVYESELATWTAAWQAATERAAKIAEQDHYGEWLAAAIRKGTNGT